MLQHKAYRFRIYPTDEQMTLMRKTLGCCRFLFNHFLAKWNESREPSGNCLSYNKCAIQLPTLKQALPWLKEVDSIALQSSVRNLADSFARFIRKQNDAPRFKSRKHPVQSYTTKHTNGNIAVIGNSIQLPKLGHVRFAKSRDLEGRILSVTVCLAPSGRWYISIVCEVDIQPLPARDETIGIDVGIKRLAVTSDGNDYENPRPFVNHEKMLQRLQRKLSRRKAGGRNWHKTKLQLARHHEKVYTRRQDVLHKLTTKWIRENQTICLEDLRIADMMKNHRLAKHIADASWGELKRQLHYKAVWYGRTIKEAPAFAPTSQMCHKCGQINPEVKDLAVREWECRFCRAVHNRDENAANNFKMMAE